MYVIGLMSGTSADGIDAALFDINGSPPNLSAQLVASYFLPYSAELRGRILKSCDIEHSRIDETTVLHFDLAATHATVVNKLIEYSGLNANQINLIGLHGQTVWHQVDAMGQVTATLQITEASVLAEQTGITTISNFRARDVALGGQGAPLTAYVDWLLLRHPDCWRAVQNIGGMGNVTFLPPLSNTSARPLAFDTGPGNALIDGAVEYISGGELIRDESGNIADTGQVGEEWLDELLEHPYLHRSPPKTTGRELFGRSLARSLVAAGRGRALTDEDIIATITMLTATSIVQAYRAFLPRFPDEIIVGGGGTHNDYLIRLMRGLAAPSTVLRHEDLGFDSDFKEAMVFAVLAYETWHGRIGTLPELTGARASAILGQITPGKNYTSLLEQTWTMQ
jgi:anhydro-N-acetylmuramic acid kinase